MGAYPNAFFKFVGASRPQAEKINQKMALKLQKDEELVRLDFMVDWWEDLPSGQEIHGVTTYQGVIYDATVVIQSISKGEAPTGDNDIIDADYVKLIHHI